LQQSFFRESGELVSSEGLADPKETKRVRAGDQAGAIARYQTAAAQTTSLPERNYLITQAARLRREPRLNKTATKRLRFYGNPANMQPGGCI
jgi:hypothetical protein